jgi:hypothetical protein
MFAGASLVFLLIAGCSTVGDLRRVASAVADKFPAENVTATLRDSKQLIVTLTNSPLAGLPDSARAAQAKLIAGEAARHYPGAQRVRSVSVVFREAAQLGPLGASQATGAYSFDAQRLTSDEATGSGGTP